MRQILVSGGLLASACIAASVVIGAQSAAAPPAGFTVLFNGKDLSGWRGRPGGGGVFSPYVEAKFTPEERAAKQTEWNADRDLHWRVDTATGETRLRRQGRAPRHREAVRRLRVPRRLEAHAARRRLGHLSAQLSAGPALGPGQCPGQEERRRQGIGRTRGTTTPTTRAAGRSCRPTSRSASGTRCTSRWSARACG